MIKDVKHLGNFGVNVGRGVLSSVTAIGSLAINNISAAEVEQFLLKRLKCLPTGWSQYIKESHAAQI